MDALAAVPAVVPKALDNGPQRPQPRAERRAAGMVLEADEGGGPPRVELAAQHDVADHARLAGDRFQVDQADAAHLVTMVAAVDVAEQLVPPAYANHHRPLAHRRPQIGLPRKQVGNDEALVPVLAAAEVVDVGRRQGIAGAAGQEVEADAAPAATPVEHGHVAPVGIDVQMLRIEMADAELHCPSQYGRTTPRDSSFPRRSSMAVYVASR